MLKTMNKITEIFHIIHIQTLIKWGLKCNDELQLSMTDHEKQVQDEKMMLKAFGSS